MKTSRDLQTALEGIVGSNVHVYFQPPENFKLSYPCVVYSMVPPKVTHADDFLYSLKEKYTITIMDRDPHSNLWRNVLSNLPKVKMDRSFIVNGAIHTVMTIVLD